VRITFAGGSGSGIDLDPPTTKDENARFFKGIICQVGLEHPVVFQRNPHRPPILRSPRRSSGFASLCSISVPIIAHRG
jgi:hypothetical protein